MKLSSSTPTSQIPLPYFPSFPRSSSSSSEEQPLKKQRTSLIPVPDLLRVRAKSTDIPARYCVLAPGASNSPSTPKTPRSVADNPTSASACKIRGLRKKKVVRSKSVENLTQHFVSLIPTPTAPQKKKKRSRAMKPDFESSKLDHSFLAWFKKRIDE